MKGGMKRGISLLSKGMYWLRGTSVVVVLVIASSNSNCTLVGSEGLTKTEVEVVKTWGTSGARVGTWKGTLGRVLGEVTVGTLVGTLVGGLVGNLEG